MTPAQINMNNPRWQRAVQVLSRMGPERKAIFDTIAADTEFADREMRSYLIGADLAARKLAQQRNVELNDRRLKQNRELSEKRLAFDKRRSDQGYRLKRKKLDYSKDEAGKAETIGYLNVGVEGISGLADLKEKRRRSRDLRSLAKNV
jgi:hypothetical protein